MLSKLTKNTTTMGKDRVIGMETMQKIKGLALTLRKIVTECNYAEMDIEVDFQKQFLEKATKKQKDLGFVISNEIRTPVLSAPETKGVTKSDATCWKPDFIIKVDNAIIPIELKLRHNGQDINGYAQDYIDDVDKVRKLIINYDDTPECYAIMLTDNEDLVQQCNKKAEEYSSANKLVDNRKVVIRWSNDENYHIGIVSRVQTEKRMSTPKDKKFEFLSDDQYIDLLLKELLLDTTENGICDVSLDDYDF